MYEYKSHLLCLRAWQRVTGVREKTVCTTKKLGIMTFSLGLTMPKTSQRDQLVLIVLLEKANSSTFWFFFSTQTQVTSNSPTKCWPQSQKLHCVITLREPKKLSECILLTVLWRLAWNLCVRVCVCRWVCICVFAGWGWVTKF